MPTESCVFLTSHSVRIENLMDIMKNNCKLKQSLVIQHRWKNFVNGYQSLRDYLKATEYHEIWNFK